MPVDRPDPGTTYHYRVGSADAALAADDNAYYQVNSTTAGTRTTSWYGSFTGVPRADLVPPGAAGSYVRPTGELRVRVRGRRTSSRRAS